MRRNLPRSKGVYLQRDILESQAFWKLSGSAIKVFLIFRMKCVIKNNSIGKHNVKTFVNNGEIQFTFQEAKVKYGIPKSTFLRARDLLIKVGLIEITENGGEHHPSKYAISENWRKYPDESFTRPKSANLVGRDTQWKTKDTVKNDTI
jgi:hypothetical protein